MPELPEVEVTRRSFADRIQSARIADLRMGKPLRWPLGVAPLSLVGRRVVGVRRRGKYLLLDLDDGLLLLHLGMSGSLNFAPVQSAAGPHDHMDLVTDKGVLRLHDPRRFGAVVWAPSDGSTQAQKLLGHLGVEPLDGGFEVNAFALALKKRQSAIKQVLLAGDGAGGVVEEAREAAPDVVELSHGIMDGRRQRMFRRPAATGRRAASRGRPRACTRSPA